MFLKDVYGFIYITTNMVNGKMYIGQKKLRENRTDSHIRTYIGSGKALKLAIDRYGKENFVKDIVAIAYSKEELDNLEREYIRLHNAVESRDYYNLSTGGEGNNTKARKNSRKVICLNTNLIFDSIRDAQAHYDIRGIYMTCMGKRRSCGKLDDGTPLIWMYYDDYINANEKEIEEKVNNSVYVVSDETREKQSKTRKGVNNGNSRKVVCVTTNEIFDTMLEGANKYKISRNTVGHCCRKEQRSAGKHPITNEKLVWMYYDEYISEKLKSAN